MAKATLLLADNDPRSLRILELALRQASFEVVTAGTGTETLKAVLSAPPDLVLCDLEVPGKDALAVCRAVRKEEKLAGLPFLLMGSEKGASARARAIEAGADEYLAKPILLKELVQRVTMLLERRKLEEPGGPAGLAGSVADLGLFDVFHSLESWRKSAVVRCETQAQVARVWVREGQVIDADLGPLQGEAAFWRLMTWDSGTFSVEFAEVDREPRIGGGTEGALMEAMRRRDELRRLTEKLPLSTQLAVDFSTLAARLDDLPDEVNGVLRSFDGRRTLREALDLSAMDDLSTVTVVQRLMADGILKVSSEKAALGKPSLQQWLSGPPATDATAAALAAGMAQAEQAELQKRRELEERAAAQVASRPPAEVKPLDIFHFPPLRGVRRERLRREAEEARAHIAAGQPVRLTHVVELPAYRPDGSDAISGARFMSPAVGEAAKKFAPDAPVSRLVQDGAGWEARTEPSFKQPDTMAQAEPVVSLTPPVGPGAERPPEPTTDPPTPQPDALPQVAPVIPSTPPPQVQAQLAAAPGAPRKRRRLWPLLIPAAAVAGAALIWLRQPATDKENAPWLAQPAASPKAPDALPGQPPLAVPAASKPAPPAQPVVTTSTFVADPDVEAYAKALDQGNALLRRGKYRGALSEFKRAVRIRPESVTALLALGDAYLEADLPKSAVRPLETAARLDGKSARAQLLLGTAYQSLGRNPDASAAYQRYLELEPSGEFAKDVKLILASLKPTR